VRAEHHALATVVIAEFQVRQEVIGDFTALARRFAAECLAGEPGCRCFDVVNLDGPPNGVLFYEIYDDAEAFEAHCRSPHLVRFKAAFAPLVVRELPLRRGLA
jgi:quinol monooxygenase YgiN